MTELGSSVPLLVVPMELFYQALLLGCLSKVKLRLNCPLISSLIFRRHFVDKLTEVQRLVQGQTVVSEIVGARSLVS